MRKRPLWRAGERVALLAAISVLVAQERTLVAQERTYDTQTEAPRPEVEVRWCQYHRHVVAEATEVIRFCSSACPGQPLVADIASACFDDCSRRYFCE